MKTYHDHVYETAINRGEYFEVTFSVFNEGQYLKGRLVKSAFQHLELNKKLVRVNRENYTAIRVWLN